jgi:hypothetical protein
MPRWHRVFIGSKTEEGSKKRISERSEFKSGQNQLFKRVCFLTRGKVPP